MNHRLRKKYIRHFLLILIELLIVVELLVPNGRKEFLFQEKTTDCITKERNASIRKQKKVCMVYNLKNKDIETLRKSLEQKGNIHIIEIEWFRKEVKREVRKEIDYGILKEAPVFPTTIKYSYQKSDGTFCQTSLYYVSMEKRIIKNDSDTEEHIRYIAHYYNEITIDRYYNARITYQ